MGRVIRLGWRGALIPMGMLAAIRLALSILLDCFQVEKLLITTKVGQVRHYESRLTKSILLGSAIFLQLKMLSRERVWGRIAAKLKSLALIVSPHMEPVGIWHGL